MLMTATMLQQVKEPQENIYKDRVQEWQDGGHFAAEAHQGGGASQYIKVLAQRPIILVLMMINLYNYSNNDLVLFKFQIFIQDLSWYLVSTKDSKSKFEANI